MYGILGPLFDPEERERRIRERESLKPRIVEAVDFETWAFRCAMLYKERPTAFFVPEVDTFH